MKKKDVATSALITVLSFGTVAYAKTGGMGHSAGVSNSSPKAIAAAEYMKRRRRHGRGVHKGGKKSKKNSGGSTTPPPK
jgi:hypothetical protein